MPQFVIDTYRELQPHNQQEWLLTNGLGGFSSSTVVGMNTRRYHGLLCAATTPPVGRILAVNRIGEMLTLDGEDQSLFELGVNTFRDSIHPRGDQFLEKFELGNEVQFTYGVAGISIIKQVQMPWMQNVTAVRYTIDPRGRQFKLSLQPFTALRDFHALRTKNSVQFQTTVAERSVSIRDGSNEVTITSDRGSFVEQPDWWYGHVYPVETERGQDDQEDLFTPGVFVIEGNTQTTITLWMGMGATPVGDWDAEVEKRQKMVLAACNDPENLAVSDSPQHPICLTKSPVIQQLFRASNDFVVLRKSPDGKPGTSVIAGYPWFSDWGRDTMISLPGLLLVTGRFHQAREVLCVFAQYVSQGMIPNRFGDYDNEPEYNTVDASLWFIHACFEYLHQSRDAGTFEKTLHPACEQIIKGYRDGTRYSIKMDPADSLISQGDAHTQLTWMDAKCGDICFTPRRGKPVEINALWYHALVLMGMKDLASKVADSFQKAFWISPIRGLADVLDGTRRDMAIRPNQIFAVSLPNSPLTAEQQAAVVDVVRRELLTPVGLRTLSRDDPGYRSRYTGDQFHRDGAYHNGTVWPWLLGPFLEAYLRVHNRNEASITQVKEWLDPLLSHMRDEGAIGQIAEIFDGDAPHRPVGCPAQAWSIAELLRIAVDIAM